MFKTGNKPGKGVYQCVCECRCNQKVVLDDNTDTLPPCPKCKHGTSYIKITFA